MEPGHRRARRRKCKPPRYPAHCSARSPLFQWLSESCAASRSLVLSTYQSVSGGQACPYMSPCRLPFQRTSVTNTRAVSKERAEFFSCAFTASSDIYYSQITATGRHRVTCYPMEPRRVARPYLDKEESPRAPP